MADPQTKKLVNPLENELPHLSDLYDELFDGAKAGEPDELIVRRADAVLAYIQDLKTGMLREIAQAANEYQRGARRRLARRAAAS